MRPQTTDTSFGTIREKEEILMEAISRWLEQWSNPHTRRSYKTTSVNFITFVQKPLSEIKSEDVRRWGEAMRRQGLAETTISVRLAAISSFFDFMLNYREESGEILFASNPVASVTRPVIQPFEKAMPLDLDQARALIEVIMKRIETGSRKAIHLRDAALISAYLLTGRHNSEVRELRWGQIRQCTGKTEVQWTEGEGDMHWHELPQPVWKAISAYLECAGRLAQIQEEDYVFVALESPFGMELRAAQQPLSERTVRTIIQRYAKWAKLKNVTVHTLRHTFTALMVEAGANPKELQRQLGFSRLGAAQHYLKQLKTSENNHWQTVAQMLGVGSDQVQDHLPQQNGTDLNGTKRPNYFRRLRK